MSFRRFIRRLVVCTRRVAAVTMTASVLWWSWPIPVGPLPARADVIPAAPPAAGQVVIEEIAWAGSGVSTADEWIELANLGDATATVAGWALRGVGESGRIVFLPPDAVITPRSAYLVANYADMDVKSALAVPVQLATTTVSLSNSALGIELVSADGATVDRAGNGHAPLAGTSSPKATMIRVSATSSGTQPIDGGDLAASWTSATTSRGFDAGIADLGTPGFCDLCVVAASLPPNDALPPNPLPEGDPATTAEMLSYTTTTEVFAEITDSAEVLINAATTTEVAPAATTTAAGETATTTADIAAIETASSTNATTTEELAAATSSYLLEAATSTTVSTTTAETVVTAATSSTIAFLVPSNTTTSAAIEQASAIPGTTVEESGRQPALSAAEGSAPTGTPLTIRLNEAMSNPASGPEWVELALADKNATATDRALELWDAVSRIANVAKGAPVTAPGFLVVTLASARLNNTGDRLELRESSQTVTDATAIPELEDGVAWARRPSDGTWSTTPMATPGAENTVPAPVIQSAPPTASATFTPAPSLAPTLSAVSATPPLARGGAVSKPKVTKKIVSKVEAPQTFLSSTPTAVGVKLAIKKQETPAKTVATSTTPTLKIKPPKQTSKASPAIIPYPFSAMFENDFNGARVRVTGIVGSVSRLLGATHAFILLGEDGRGVIAYLPKHLNVPPLGAAVRVSGTLTSTYRGPELRMQKSDVWMTVKGASSALKTRAVDLLMPGAEDSWSLMTATGTVKDVKARSFMLDVDGVDVQVNVPPAVKYRPQRLVRGDTVNVTALLDLRRDAPALLPRTPDEIEIVRHAPSSITAASTDHASRFPDWTPFGAAAGAVALTGAAQRLRELLRRRRLEALATKANVAT